jgi:hypothetical protein
MTDDQPRAGTEAARLLAAAQEWLRTSAPHLAPVDVDGTPCSCPVCRVVASVREADPDDVTRFVDSAVGALSSLAVQAADLAGTVREQAATWASPETYDDEADDDAPGYAVDVDEVDDDSDLGADDDVDSGAEGDDGDEGEAAPGPRTVRRITIERED